MKLISSRRSPFTMIEILTVLAIIAVLAAALLAGVRGVRKKAAVTRWQAYSANIRTDPYLARYYTFQHDPDDEDTVANLAAGRSDDVSYRADLFDATRSATNPPEWVTGKDEIKREGRFRDKSLMKFGATGYLELGTVWRESEKWPAATVAAWCRTDQTGSQVLVSMWDTDPKAFELSVNGDTVRWNTATDSNEDPMQATLPALTNGDWHLIVATYDSERKRKEIFVDGEMLDSKLDLSFDKSLRNAEAAVITGRIGENANSGFNFQGYIDEVLIFKRALSSGEVRQMYDSTKP